MTTFSVSKSFGWAGKLTERVAAAMRMFGVTAERLRKRRMNHSCRIKIEPGDVVYITGPSGAGKSVLLRELEREISRGQRINLDEIELSSERAVIDCVGADLMEGLRLLSVAGLSDVFCILSRPVDLSEGQKQRFRLAMAMAAGKEYIFADEFCSNLDRISACVISYNVQKYAKRNKVTFILASSHDDVLGDLQADVIVNKELSGQAETIYRNNAKVKAKIA